MFSVQEKMLIASEIEKLLLTLNHPEMPKEKPMFTLHVDGKESWSWADIKPNWIYADGKEPIGINPFNEASRELHKELNGSRTKLKQRGRKVVL